MSFLSITDLEKSYQTVHQKISILDKLNLNIEKSEIVAILGKSGSGKSTLLGLLAGLDSADQGQIKVGGVDVSTLNQDQLTAFRAQNIGIIFQNFYLVNHLNVYENVILPLQILNQPIDQSYVESLINGVGLSDRRKHTPTQLSGGESQRLAIARALVTKPQFILADEPSGSLDSETGISVMKLFFDIVRKYQMTTILVTHDESLAHQCDKIYKLENKKLSLVK